MDTIASFYNIKENKMKNEIINVASREVSWAYKQQEFSDLDSLKKAIKYAEYSWWNILIALKELGIVTTPEEELKIKTKLVYKKYAYLIR